MEIKTSMNNKLKYKGLYKYAILNNKSQQEIWKRYLRLNNFDYFITATFRYNLSYSQSVGCINQLLHMVNSCLYGRDYKKKNIFLEGFAVVEGERAGNIHYHFLIDGSNIINKKNNTIIDVWNKKLPKIKVYNSSKYCYSSSAISPFGVNFQETYSRDVVDYCLKDICNWSTGNIMPLSVNGLCAL